MLNSDMQRRCLGIESDGAESTFGQLFGISSIGMALLDMRGKFLSANTALCESLGYSEDELREMRCEELLGSYSKGQGARLFRSFDKIPTTSWQTERTLFRKGRSPMPARIWVSSLRRSFLEDSVSLLIIEDITEQKVAEQELNKRTTEVEMLASQLIQSQETERKRLARELHDDIGQRLSLVASEVALMASQCSDADAIARGRLSDLRDDLDSLCSDIHNMSHNLHSYKLQHLGLKSALMDLCRKLSHPGFRVHIDVDDMDEPVSKDVSLCLYRVVQEALNNALRHAHTLVVAVTITKIGDMFYMTIQDAGIGFDRDASPQGLGLISMTERLKLVKGELKLQSIIGRGTEIWVSVPDERKSLELYADCQVEFGPHGSVDCAEVA